MKPKEVLFNRPVIMLVSLSVRAYVIGWRGKGITKMSSFFYEVCFCFYYDNCE